MRSGIGIISPPAAESMIEVTNRQLALNAQRWGRLSCREKDALVVLPLSQGKVVSLVLGFMIITAKSKGIA